MKLIVGGNRPSAASTTRAMSGLLNSCPVRTTSASRQSPDRPTTAYSKVWLQCWNWKFDPSGTVRCGGSIHTPDGQPLHERITDRYMLPSVSTLKPGRPRFMTATLYGSTSPVVPLSE